MTPKGIEGFLQRGNVVELAVAVVIGAAFTAGADRIAESLLTPLLNLVGGGGQLDGALEVDGQAFTWGAPVSQLVTFVSTAAVIYSHVALPMKAFVERRARGEEPGPAHPTQAEPLAEIRDLPRAQPDAGAAQAPSRGSPGARER